MTWTKSPWTPDAVPNPIPLPPRPRHTFCRFTLNTAWSLPFSSLAHVPSGLHQPLNHLVGREHIWRCLNKPHSCLPCQEEWAFRISPRLQVPAGPSLPPQWMRSPPPTRPRTSWPMRSLGCADLDDRGDGNDAIFGHHNVTEG